MDLNQNKLFPANILTRNVCVAWQHFQSKPINSFPANFEKVRMVGGDA